MLDVLRRVLKTEDMYVGFTPEGSNRGKQDIFTSDTGDPLLEKAYRDVSFGIGDVTRRLSFHWQIYDGFRSRVNRVPIFIVRVFWQLRI